MLFISIFFFLSLFLGKIVLAGGSSFVQASNPEAPQIFPTQTNTPTIAYQSRAENNVNWPEILIGAVIGWVLSLLSVLAIDHLKEPNLSFEIGSIGDDVAKQWRFIHIKIKNLKRKYKFSPFSTIPAFASKAIVKVEDKSFVGRWTSKEQPIGNISEVINKALVHPREDIYPYTGEHEAVEVAIGIKYENEDKFYGFNNESYLPTHKDLKNKKYEFRVGDFNGELVISTLGKNYTQKFVVHNKSKKRSDFWLELV